MKFGWTNAGKRAFSTSIEASFHELNAAKQIQFQQIHQGILRKDPYAASVAMCKTMLIMEHADINTLKRNLELILSNSDDDDWGNILFAALQYGRAGDADTAGKLILRNLDNGHIAFIDSPDMISTVGPALLLNS